jgi:hypothetical protein
VAAHNKPSSPTGQAILREEWNGPASFVLGSAAAFNTTFRTRKPPETGGVNESVPDVRETARLQYEG